MNMAHSDLSETPRFIWGLSKITINRTPEELPNDIKSPYNQWETPLEFSYYKFRQVGMSQMHKNSSGVIQQTLINP